MHVLVKAAAGYKVQILISRQAQNQTSHGEHRTRSPAQPHGLGCCSQAASKAATGAYEHQWLAACSSGLPEPCAGEWDMEHVRALVPLLIRGGCRLANAAALPAAAGREGLVGVGLMAPTG